MKQVIVDRKHWNRGFKLFFKSRFVDEKGNRDIFGFCFEQFGIKKANLKNQMWPSDLATNLNGEFPTEMNWSVEFAECRRMLLNSELARQVMDINDTKKLTEEERENKLSTLFANNSVELQFIN